MKIVVAILALLVIAAVLVLALAAMKPDTLRVERTIGIKAPPEKIFPLINDFHSWGVWSPYEKKDPAMKRTFSGAEKGVGAVYEWQGDKNVGQGRMEIAEASPSSKIVIRLHFISPFEANNIAEFTIAPKSDESVVTWAMHGPAPFMSKVMQIFINMDNMIGKDFAQGLANLKAAAEK